MCIRDSHIINSAINKALAEHDIAIPFPQRDLHLVSGQFDAKEQTKHSEPVKEI